MVELAHHAGEAFGTRLARAFADRGHLCVGIDPHSYLLGEWSLPDNADGVREFGLRVIDAAAGRVGIIKPQIAFFERHGSAGYVALETVLAAARSAGLLVIADVKRGDVGSTVEAYGQAWLTPGHPLEADAITIYAYQGFGSIETTLRGAEHSAKGIFVVTATSNPESVAIQTAVIGTDKHRGRTVAASILEDVDEWNSRYPTAPMGSVGVVIGATVDFSRYGMNLDTTASPATPVLAPGFGHQGASIAELRGIFGLRAASTIVTESRSILSAGPAGVAEAIGRQAGAVAESFANG